MKNLFLKKSGHVLHAADTLNDEVLAAMKNGEYMCELTRPRNYLFLKKYFCLMNYAFQNWEVPEGLKVEVGRIYKCHNGNVGICRENELPGKDIYPFFLEFFHVARNEMSVPRNYTESGHAHHERHSRPDNIKFEIVTPNPQ